MKKYTVDFKNSNKEAIVRLVNMEPYKTSCGICGTSTYGYGELSEYGYFEFPLVFKEESSE